MPVPARSAVSDVAQVMPGRAEVLEALDEAAAR